MPKYRKKPVVIEAIEYTTPQSVLEIIEMNGSSTGIINSDYGLHIDTLEGTMRADKGDYIIKGVNGELYPCKPDIFEKTYEAV